MKKRRSLVFFTVGLFASIVSASAAMSDAEIDSAVEALLGRMTLAEKLGQMSQSNYPRNGVGVDGIQKTIQTGEIGSLLNVDGPATANRLQRIAVEQSRLKIPLIIGLDVIHGFRTLFPIPVAQSCSWDPALVAAAAHVAAVEASDAGVRWTFSPMLDLTRDPRWGRIAETLGEDPYLASQLGAAMVRGYQGNDLSDPHSIAACAKHFVGYGAVEAGRDYNTALIPDAELRNQYLPAFKAAADAGVLTFMSAFEDLNGVPASANRFTLHHILRDEWGFRGFVVSDWESVLELISHGAAAGPRDAAQRAITGGVDMEMVSTTYRDHGEDLLQHGQISAAALDDAVRHILRVKFTLGLFAQPYTDTTKGAEALTPEHLSVARQLATESVVLLKNDGGMLPLESKAKTVAVIGPLADSAADMRGCWFCQSQPGDCRTVLAALPEYLGAGVKLVSAQGLVRSVGTDTTGFASAVEAAKQADVVLMCIGESQDLSGEARSRAFIDLPGAQEQLVEAVAATGKPIVLVVFAGRPLIFARAAAHAQAVLYAWHPGTMAGPAICDVLFGRANPSGKLTFSFPRTIGQIPIYYNHKNTGRPAQNEDLGVPMGTPQDPRGFFSKYIDVHSSPVYPFGYGLSYTRYEYSDLTVTGPDQAGALTATATIANTGSRDGVEIAQFYTHQRVGSLTRPVKELKGFERVALKAGERRTVTFHLPRQALGYYDAAGKFLVEPGHFDLWIGGSSAEGLHGEFELPR